MANISYLREKYGFSQQQIADWLDVSRSLVTRYENATRKLPSAADSRHNQLLILMAKMDTEITKTVKKRKPHPESARRIADTKKELEYQAKLAAHNAVIMKKKLLAIQKQYIQTRDLMDLLDKMLNNLSKEKDKRSSSWLQAQYVHAKKQLLKCDEAAQLQMKAKIVVLEASAEKMNYEL